MEPDYKRLLSRCRRAWIGVALTICTTGCGTSAPVALPESGPAGQNVSGIQTAGSGGSGAPAVAITPGSGTSVSLFEQLALERVNRARLLPGPEAAAGGITINEGLTPPKTLSTIPKQAVAMNPTLRRTAVFHSRDMLNQDYFSHNEPGGASPFDRMRREGFSFIAAGENLAWRGTTGTIDPVATIEMQHDDLFIDTSVPGRGHRLVMLDDRFREVGIGVARGSFRREDGTVFTDSIMQTQDYGTSPSDNTFVLGVVYTDANGNGQYDFGEGTANSRVVLNDQVEFANSAGGYSFRVAGSGAFTLRFASGRTQALSIQPGDPNIKVDFVDGRRVVVNLGLGPLN